MSLLKTAVFLASRFEEFSELRKAIKSLIINNRHGQLTPIDLNDGAVSYRPPISECLSYVRRSEIMVLLMGDSYGILAPKSDKSFTHLEYEEAIKEGVGTRVLVFGIGEHYRGGRIRYADNANLASWQKQVEEEHTLGFFDPDTPVEVMAKKIFDSIFEALYEMSFGLNPIGADGAVPEEISEDLEDDTFFDESEVRTLDERGTRNLSLVDDRSQFNCELQVLTQPAAIQALEQREEAQRALDIGEYGVAITHLKRALEIKPLELISNYWLAQLYVALDRKEKSSEAMEMAIRAARIAMRDKLPYRASAAYAIGARAATLAKRPGEALELAQKAVDAAPRYARAHIELARQLVIRSEFAQALESIKQAYLLFPRSIRDVYIDPMFKPLRNDCNALVAKQKAKLATDVAELLQAEAGMATSVGKARQIIELDGKSYSELIQTGRQSVQRQAEYVSRFFAEAAEKDKELTAEPHRKHLSIQEVLTFNWPGRARIVAWHKEPGDLIAPGDAVFSFHYERSSAVKQWTLRVLAPVLMTSRAGNDGIWVSDQTPFVFEHIPGNVSAQEVPQGAALREATRVAQSQLELSETSLSDARAQTAMAQNALQQVTQKGIQKPGSLLLTAGIALVLIGIWLLTKSFNGLGISLEGIAIFVLLKGREQRVIHHGTIETCQRNLTQASTALETAEDTVEKSKSDLNLAHDELRQFETSVDMLKERARKMFHLFERVGLRYGRLAPYSSLYSAKAGDLVRFVDKQLNDFSSQTGRMVEVMDDLPEWLRTEEPEALTKLLKVVSSTSQKMVLSRYSAYQRSEEKSFSDSNQHLS